MSEPVTVTLRQAIKFGDTVVTELRIRPVKAKDLRRINQADSATETALKMAGWLSGQVTQVIDELEGEDLRDVLAAVNDFFLVIRGTGEKSSDS